MSAAHQAQVVEPGWPTIAPEDEVMPVAPGRRPVTTRKDTVPVPSHQCPTRGRRDRPGRVRHFQLELAQPGDPGDGRVAGEPTNRLGGDRAAPLEFAGRRS